VALTAIVFVAPARGETETKSRGGAVDTTRIVSVGAAVTETLFALGAGARVVATDTTSLWPDEARKLPRVGYMRTLAAEGILSLEPSVVLVTTEAGPPATLAQLRDAGVEVVQVTAEPSPAGVGAMMRELAALVAADPKPLLDALDADLATARTSVEARKVKPSVLFVLQPPGMGTPLAAGMNTAADAMLTLAGARNTATALDGYKPLTAEAAVAAAPDVIAVPEGTVQRIGGTGVFLESAGLGLTPAGRNGRVVEVPTHILTLGPNTGRAAIDLARLLDTALASEPSSAMQ
jgi:iron complex transport system substrate-binding protein